MSLGFSSRRVQAGLTGLALSCLMAAPAQAETLADACATTLQTHPALQADRAAIRAAEEAVSTARSGFFPTLKLNSELNANNTYRPIAPASLYGRAGTLQAEQMLFDGFRTASQADAADADRAATEADYQANANAVLYGAVRAYLFVLRDRELLEAAKRFREEHRKSIARVTEIVSHDGGKQFDLVQLQMRDFMAASYVTEREGALRASEGQFREVVGHEPGQLSKPTALKGAGFTSLAEALAVAETSHPAVRAASERLRKRQAEQAQASSVLMPRLDLTARYTKGWDRQAIAGANDEAYAGMQASYALATGGAQLATIRNAEALVTSTRERLNAAKRDAREAVRVAWAQRESLGKTIPLADDYLKKTLEVVAGYEVQYSLGRRSVLELLLIRNEIYSSETRLIGLTYDRLLTDYALATQMGVLRSYFPENAVSASPGGSSATVPTLKRISDAPSMPPKSP